MMTYLPHFTILIVILLCAGIYENKIKYNKLYFEQYEGKYLYKGPLTPWLLVFGYLALLAGMRSGMNDTSVYIASFNNTEASWETLRLAFGQDIKYAGTTVLTVLFKMFISDNYHTWFLTWAIVESCLLVNVLRREAVSFLDACFFFFASTLYYNYFSMMRQWMAVAISFWGCRYLRDDKMIKYFVTCLIAALFHTSAVVMIPVFFLVRGRPWDQKQNIFIALFAIAMLFLNPLLATLETIAEGSAYDYAISTMGNGSGSSIIRAFIAAVPVYFAYTERENIEDPMINVCVNVSLVNLLLNFLASFTSGLYVIRLATYMSVYNTILFPYLLNRTSWNKSSVKAAFYTLYLALYIYQNNHMGSWGYKSDILTWLTNY